MNEPAFPYDVFLSHSAKDKAVVRPLAERLRKDGLKVLWFDEWVLKAGDSILAKIEEGLLQFDTRNSAFGLPRLCLSANAFGSDWAQLEAGTCGRDNLPFHNPLNEGAASPHFIILHSSFCLSCAAPWRNFPASTGGRL